MRETLAASAHLGDSIGHKSGFVSIPGDAIYADNDGKTAWTVTEPQLQGEWNRLADKPEFQRYRSLISIMAKWDSYDCGTHDDGCCQLGDVSNRVAKASFTGEAIV